jgi:hypothetical protein
MNDAETIICGAFVGGVVLGVFTVGVGDARTLFGVAFALGAATLFTVLRLPKYLGGGKQ